ncbi:MAG: trimethylamine methyltransferase family protein [Pseudomonadota bacterium]
MAESRPQRRGGGRAARVAARQAAPVQNPAAPGQRGGRYAPLSEAELLNIYRTALRLLSELGLGESPPVLVEAALGRGAQLSPEGRLCFPRGLVEDVIAGACTRFTLHGREPRHSIELGGDRVYFGTGGAAVQTLDLETGRYRPSTLRDLLDFTRLADNLPNISWFTRCCIATDVPDPFDLDINTAYALIRGTTKPVGTSFSTGAAVAPVVDMFDIAMGGTGRFRRQPCLKAHISPIVSPLRFGVDAVDVTLACVAQGVPINAIIAAQAGATAPATLAGFLAQSLAETLAGLVMINIFAPGHPAIFSNWPFVIDLRTGAFAGSGGESAVMNAASAQISNWLGLPSGVAAAMADAKAVDAQMGAEKALAAVTAGLAGANMVYESAGMMASLLGASFEAFVLDDEMLSHVHRTIRGVEVDEETLGYDAIAAAVRGDGHFLGSDQTLAAMERDYFYPSLADRDPPVTWAEKGAPDIRARARDTARAILAAPASNHLGETADAAIRARWDIHMPQQAVVVDP